MHGNSIEITGSVASFLGFGVALGITYTLGFISGWAAAAASFVARLSVLLLRKGVRL